jgi:hypothetical protein
MDFKKGKHLKLRIAAGSWRWLLCVCLALSTGVFAQQPAGPAAAQTPTPEAASASGQQEALPVGIDDEDIPEGELAPAVVTLDVSHTSPLIQTLYAATRETKEQAILDRLAEAKKQIDSGADLKPSDDLGRTALHWAIFGSSYATTPKLIVGYEEVADDLIQHGVEINHEDAYNDTALDYLLYSPNFEMQTLMIEHGATSGFLVASFNFIDELTACRTPGALPAIGRTSENAGKNPEANAGPNADAFPAQAAIAQHPTQPSNQSEQATRIAKFMKSDLSPGETLSVRLNVPVYSDRSRTGDPMEATVTYPLCTNGEQLACKPGELLIAPGTKINGTVLFAQKAPDKYWRPRLVLDFSNVVHADGKTSPLYARVIDVDNSRETVRNNEILGIIQPHAGVKASLAMAAVSAVNPIAGYTIKAVQTVYGLSIRREILFPAGTDIQIQVVRPSMLKEKADWPGWPTMPLTPELQAIVHKAPLRTAAKNGTPSDLTDLMFLGSQAELASAFNEAGWFEADALTMGSAIKTAQATMRQAGYTTAPVSSLTLEGRPPDLVFQKSLDTFAKRHHVRIWKLPATYQGREVWVGAATHDISVDRARAGTKWSHRIDPHIDRERDWVESDLLFAGTGIRYVDVPRPGAPRITKNATGDQILTDGIMTVVAVGKRVAPGTVPALQTRP